jgi:hypothetical protein
LSFCTPKHLCTDRALGRCCRLQEGALTALASVADCSQEQFVRYYDVVMPLLSQILHNAQNKEHRCGWLRSVLICSDSHSPAVVPLCHCGLVCRAW